MRYCNRIVLINAVSKLYNVLCIAYLKIVFEETDMMLAIKSNPFNGYWTSWMKRFFIFRPRARPLYHQSIAEPDLKFSLTLPIQTEVTIAVIWHRDTRATGVQVKAGSVDIALISIGNFSEDGNLTRDHLERAPLWRCC